jgi:uncharacterized protein YndB with AHSA1/START domain
MGKQRSVSVERIIDAPLDQVFARYTDHVGWSTWAKLGRVTLAKTGSPDANGVGCVRVFHSAMEVREEIVAFDPPHRMTYRLVRGPVPLKNHEGQVTFEPHARGTRLVWSCRFEAVVPLTGGVLERALTRLFDKVLTRFVRRGLAPETGPSVARGQATA